MNIQEIEQRFEEDYLLGCIKKSGRCDIYLMPIAWWILNYKKYDPQYNPNEWKDVFRDHIYNVTDNQIENFLRSVDEDKLNTEELVILADNMPLRYRHLFFYIDFDDKLFVNGFSDIEVESYLPDENWKGFFGVPIDYLPIDLKKLMRV
jgi:hypothetical protein